MGRVKKVIFTVTNDLVTDQRMQRICGAFHRRGYDVVLVGRQLQTSESVDYLPYKTRRLVCFFNKGIPNNIPAAAMMGKSMGP